jgi:hypothetical protein
MTKSQERLDMESLARKFLKKAFSEENCSFFLSNKKLIVEIRERGGFKKDNRNSSLLSDQEIENLKKKAIQEII